MAWQGRTDLQEGRNKAGDTLNLLLASSSLWGKALSSLYYAPLHPKKESPFHQPSTKLLQPMCSFQQIGH